MVRSAETRPARDFSDLEQRTASGRSYTSSFFHKGCRMSSSVLTFIWRYVADNPLISHPCETLGPVLIHLMNSTSTRPPVLIIVLSLFSFSLGLLTPADFSCMCVPHQTRLAGTCPAYVFVRGLGRLLLLFSQVTAITVDPAVAPLFC